jgi:restriction system protein
MDAFIGIVFFGLIIAGMAAMIWDARRTDKGRRVAVVQRGMLVSSMSPGQYEAHVAAHLRRKGWNARVTGHVNDPDHGVDVVAVDPNGVRWAVQVKRYSSPVGVKAVQEVVAGMRMHGCSQSMVYASHSYTTGARRLAAANGTKLVTLV